MSRHILRQFSELEFRKIKDIFRHKTDFQKLPHQAISIKQDMKKMKIRLLSDKKSMFIKVKVAKEVGKRSDGLWRLACGNVFTKNWNAPNGFQFL